MDDLERRLVELNEQLLKTYQPRYCANFSMVNVSTGSGSDSVFISTNTSTENDVDDDCEEHKEEVQCKACCPKTVVVNADYMIKPEDYYVGVQSDDPVKIILPKDVDCNVVFVVKAEFGAPVGNRKITIMTEDGSQIDGDDEIVLQQPFESRTFIKSGSHYFTI